MKFFPRGRSALSAIFNYMIDYILNEKEHVLKSFNQPYLSRDKINVLCESIKDKASPYKRCFGLIDGTVRAVCRPTADQREVAHAKLLHFFSFLNSFFFKKSEIVMERRMSVFYFSFSFTTAIREYIPSNINLFYSRMA